MSKAPTTGAHRAMVAGLFPHVGPIASFDPVGDGWVSFTYLVNDTWIVQIPRAAEGVRSMTSQLDVLPGLAGELSARIPEPEHVSRDPLVVAYRMIHGSPFSDVGLEGVWPERLGRFLYDLHMVPPEFVGMRARGADAVRQERRAELETFRIRVFPLLDRRERDSFAGLFDAHLDDDENWRFATCLTHGDLGPEHVLVSASGDLAGVIDWEETSVGDPAWDFAYLLHAWPDAGERALAAYGGAPDPRFLDRAAFGYLQMPWHEVIYGLETGRDVFVASGLQGVRDRVRTRV